MRLVLSFENVLAYENCTKKKEAVHVYAHIQLDLNICVCVCVCVCVCIHSVNLVLSCQIKSINLNVHYSIISSPNYFLVLSTSE